jgi:hypothetical protein
MAKHNAPKNAPKQDEAAKRKERLQALRQKPRARSTQPGRLDATGIASSIGDQGEATGAGRARLLKFLAEQRTQSQEGSNTGGSGATGRRRQLLTALAGDGTGGGAAALERFPRLKELLAQGRGKGMANIKPKVSASSSPEEISRYREDLETRASRLEQALKRTLAELDEVQNLEASRTGTVADTKPEQPDNQTQQDARSAGKGDSRDPDVQ